MLGLAAAIAAGCSNAAVPAPPGAHSRQSLFLAPCPAWAGRAAITLTDTSPARVVTVPLGALVVVTVPGWGWSTATDVHVVRGGVLRETCTVLLPGRGRRTIFRAARTGRTWVSATVEPASNLMMPAWGGEVTVRGAQH